MSETCREYITLVLKRGGRWTNEQVRRTILHDFRVPFQNNTIAKYLSFMIREGVVSSGPVIKAGKTQCHEYWLVKESKKRPEPYNVSAGELISHCRSIAAGYPDGHPEIEKIQKQCIVLENKCVKGALC